MGHLRRNFTRLALLGPVPSCLSELHTCVLSHSVVSDCVPPHGLYVAHQAPLSMEFSRQEYWNGLPFPTPGDLPHPRTETSSPASAGEFFTTESPGKPVF